MLPDEKNTDPVEDDEDAEGGCELTREEIMGFAGMAETGKPGEEEVVSADQLLKIVEWHHGD